MPSHADPPISADAAEGMREEARVDEIVARGPSGTFAVVGVATFIVVAIFFLFYLLVYLPRGAVQ
jgi:hypothetical protein